jgi:hypothetical protein
MRMRERVMQPDILLCAGGLLLIAALFLSVSARNPPGFYRDESSIAYNAATLAAHGRDEYNAHFPLFIRSFGDYKSPVYVYLLAAVFRITGPSTQVARSFSAVVGLGAIAVLFALALAVTKRRLLSLAVALAAGLSPWIFEVTRLVFEVALEPLLIALLLIVLYRAPEVRWRTREAVSVGVLLAAIAYTYQAGKVLAVLYAIGIAAIYGKRQPRAVALALGIVAVALGLLVPYQARHPGALSARVDAVGYIHAGATWWKVPAIFVKRYLIDVNLWTWAAHGDPNARHHVPGAGSIFFTATVVALVGLVIVARRRRSSPWWRFVIFGAFTSAVPTALTVDPTHSLRTIALPVFLAALTIPGLEWIFDLRNVLARALVVAVLGVGFTVEAIHWQVIYRRDGPNRAEALEVGFPDAFGGALRHGGTIFAQRSDHTAYIDSLLYGLLAGRARSSIVILDPGQRPPPGSVVMGRTGECPNCTRLAQAGGFESYVAPG